MKTADIEVGKSYYGKQWPVAGAKLEVLERGLPAPRRYYNAHNSKGAPKNQVRVRGEIPGYDSFNGTKAGDEKVVPAAKLLRLWGESDDQDRADSPCSRDGADRAGATR
jgi:hypothetical protein